MNSWILFCVFYYGHEYPIFLVSHPCGTKGKKMKRLPALGGLLFAVFLLVAACTSKSPTETEPPLPEDSTSASDTSDSTSHDSTSHDSTDDGEDFLTHDSTLSPLNGEGVRVLKELTPADVEDSMEDMLALYDPIPIGREWVYRRTQDGQVDYQYHAIEENSIGEESIVTERIRTSENLEDVRNGTMITRYHGHGRYDVYIYSDCMGDLRRYQLWPFHCFTAAQAGDTIRYRASIVNGDLDYSELVRVVGWDETVVLPDTTFTGCYSVLIDTVIWPQREGRISRPWAEPLWRRTVTDVYAPGFGLAKRTDVIIENGVSHTTTLEAIPARFWPWYYEPPTEPGEPGDDILRYFPLNNGRQWDYLQTQPSWVGEDSVWIRRRCQAPVPEGDFFRYRSIEYRSAIQDTAHMEEGAGETLEFTYNGNSVLQWDAYSAQWEAVKQFYRFPDAASGEVIFDWTRGYTIYAHVEVIATDTTVTVPAGTFHEVYVVEYSRAYGELTHFSDHLYYYYAPGVGLVRLMGQHRVDMESYEVLQELMDYSTGE